MVAAHEPGWSMRGPLVVLALLALGGGALASPFARLYGEPYHFHFGTTSALAAGLALSGFALAYVFYGHGRRTAPAFVGWIESAAQTRAINRVYETGFRGVTLPFAAALAWIDRYVVDGLINISAWATLETGRSARKIQTGYAPDYVLAVLVGVVGVAAWAVLQ
jgi:NADH:ubiquinone oxidoreductase subunit 5 (subunit L)/multisubunit Na+/H+ antiporter MnhA subunit